MSNGSETRIFAQKGIVTCCHAAPVPREEALQISVDVQFQKPYGFAETRRQHRSVQGRTSGDLLRDKHYYRLGSQPCRVVNTHVRHTSARGSDDACCRGPPAPLHTRRRGPPRFARWPPPPTVRLTVTEPVDDHVHRLEVLADGTATVKTCLPIPGRLPRDCVRANSRSRGRRVGGADVRTHRPACGTSALPGPEASRPSAFMLPNHWEAPHLWLPIFLFPSCPLTASHPSSWTASIL